jgi:hypothetical protein
MTASSSRFCSASSAMRICRPTFHAASKPSAADQVPNKRLVNCTFLEEVNPEPALTGIPPDSI